MDHHYNSFILLQIYKLDTHSFCNFWAMFRHIRNGIRDRISALLFVMVLLLKTLKFYPGTHNLLNKLHKLDLWVFCKMVKHSNRFRKSKANTDTFTLYNLLENFLRMIRLMKRLLALLVFWNIRLVVRVLRLLDSEQHLPQHWLVNLGLLVGFDRVVVPLLALVPGILGAL